MIVILFILCFYCVSLLIVASGNFDLASDLGTTDYAYSLLQGSFQSFCAFASFGLNHVDNIFCRLEESGPAVHLALWRCTCQIAQWSCTPKAGRGQELQLCLLPVTLEQAYCSEVGPAILYQLFSQRLPDCFDRLNSLSLYIACRLHRTISHALRNSSSPRSFPQQQHRTNLGQPLPG